MKLLVTGGAGFIGSNFIHYILKKYPSYSIVNLDALTYAGNLENLRKWENDSRYTFVKGDICDEELVSRLVKDADAIVHFAAESHVDRSIRQADVFVRTNVLGTQVLLDAARRNGNKRFHHVSTDEVFGSLGLEDAPFSEITPHNPRSPYSASKAASDHLVGAYYHTYELPITISNCSNNYGPYHFPEKLLPLAITNVLEGKKIPIYGDGMQIRDWLYVEDHCRAIDAILHRGRAGETYCVGGNAERTNLDLIKQLLLIMGKGEEYIEFVGDRRGHDRRYAIDFSKIKNELGWEPQVDLETGLRQTVAWFEQNQDWWHKVKSGDYQKYYEQQYSNR
jgi:dTDP-glucose 4,6-dehydratase